MIAQARDGSRPAAPGRRVATLAVVTVWLARAAWLAVAALGGAAVGDALDGRSGPVQVVGTAGAWLGWAAGAVGLAVAGVATLTLVRTVVPGSLVVAAVTLIGGADAGREIALVAPAVAATAIVSSAEFGRVYIQASAYGDELRFGLRPPFGYLLASGVTWVIAVAAIVLAPLAWAAGAWAAAPPLTLVAAASLYLLPVRWHQLSRRWLVFVPAGIVVHDPVVLADTLMVRRHEVTSVLLDDRGAARQTAADLTGPTPGIAVEVTLAKPTTAVLAARPRNPTGTPIHLSAFVVSPTRPGAALRAAADRGY